MPPDERPSSWALVSISDSDIVLTAHGLRRQVTAETLNEDLQQAVGPPSGGPVIVLRADRRVRYVRFMSVVNAVNVAGYRMRVAEEEL